jgi:vacuolar-type H+-ATPase subunit B/Vma2
MTRPFRELADATETPESRRIAHERTLELLAAEIASLRLTAEEREAIEFAAGSFADQFVQHGDASDREIAATLRKMLARLA